jgi:hypothetical protein
VPVAPAESAALRFRPVDPLFGDSWDEIVADHPSATIFHTSAWARVLADTYRYQPRYFATETPTGPLALPLFEVDSWLTGRRGIALPFTDECRPLGNGPGDFRKFFDEALRIGRTRSWSSFELRGGQFEEPSLSFYRHTLDLAKGSDELFAKVDASARRAVRKAERSNLSFELANSIESVRAYYRLHCLTRRTHGLPPQPFEFFRNIHRHLIGKGTGFIALAMHQGQPIAGAVFLHYRSKVHYKFGASDSRFDSLRGNNFVMWRAIQHCIARRFGSLDFGRTSLSNEGLRRYKLLWGTSEDLLHYGRWSPRANRSIVGTDRSSGLQHYFFRACPLPFSRFLGKLLYRHIA